MLHQEWRQPGCRQTDVGTLCPFQAAITALGPWPGQTPLRQDHRYRRGGGPIDTLTQRGDGRLEGAPFARARENRFFQARHGVRYPLSGANAPAETCAGDGRTIATVGAEGRSIR
jgi:hypothetical protein